MLTVTNQIPATTAAHTLPTFPPLEQVTRPTVPTDAAAYYLNRQPQTLRAWLALRMEPCARCVYLAALRGLLPQSVRC